MRRAMAAVERSTAAAAAAAAAIAASKDGQRRMPRAVVGVGVVPRGVVVGTTGSRCCVGRRGWIEWWILGLLLQLPLLVLWNRHHRLAVTVPVASALVIRPTQHTHHHRLPHSTTWCTGSRSIRKVWNPPHCPTTTRPQLHSPQLSSSSSSSQESSPAVDDDTSSTNQSATTSSLSSTPLSPICFSGGYSTAPNYLTALQEAVAMAMAGLPQTASTTTTTTTPMIDLCFVTMTSVYDNNSNINNNNNVIQPPFSLSSPAVATVPAILAAVQAYGGGGVRHILGCTGAATIASRSGGGAIPWSSSGNNNNQNNNNNCETMECEGGLPSVSVTLAILPDCQLHTFHVATADLPDPTAGDAEATAAKDWKRAVGVSRVGNDSDDSDSSGATTMEQASSSSSSPPLFWLLPSPSFATNLDTLTDGLAQYFPGCSIVGGIASTISSLSRAKLYKWSSSGDNNNNNAASDVCFSEGCVGVAIAGDLLCQSMLAHGAKPVGGIYQILKGQDTTIQIIVLDEIATDALNLEEGNDDEEDDTEEEDDDDDDTSETTKVVSPEEAKAAMAQVYAKARIPKPVLAEANFLMRTLSDDDQAFMRRQLLVGLEQGGSVGRSPSELARLAAGLGHRFTVHPVASAGMKDGSVSLALGSVNISPGTRLRFFVREPDFARREIDALWTGYKKRVLDYHFRSSTNENVEGTKDIPLFAPAYCFLVPTLDRGIKIFQGSQPNYESSTAARMLPSVSCVSGFFSNGVIGKMDGTDEAKVGVQGSASGYFLFGSKSGRPIYSPALAAQTARDVAASAIAQMAEDDDATDRISSSSSAGRSNPARRSENGELILKRREVHAGRALTVSTVEWSVVEKAAKPSSALEGFMWDKETEVDRFRERVPLSNLASQCRATLLDPSAPKPRDWIGPVRSALKATDSGFVVIPECKRTDPANGTLRRRYDVSALVRDFTMAGAPALSVNCDAVLFGGALEHITEARQSSSLAAVAAISDVDVDGVIPPPILASDLILYPYQLYKLRLAGADAVNLVIGALLGSKDVFYLAKIASSLSLQILVTVTSTVQLERVTEGLPKGSLQGIIVSNRVLEDFSIDETGEQALSLLKSAELQTLLNKHGAEEVLVLVEGQVGIIERNDDSSPDTKASSGQYLKELRAAGADGAIVGSGLAAWSAEELRDVLDAFQGLKSKNAS